MHLFNRTLAEDFVPLNQDRWVAEFICQSPQEVLARVQAGELTVAVVQTLIQGLRYCA